MVSLTTLFTNVSNQKIINLIIINHTINRMVVTHFLKILIRNTEAKSYFKFFVLQIMVDNEICDLDKEQVENLSFILFISVTMFSQKMSLKNKKDRNIFYTIYECIFDISVNLVLRILIRKKTHYQFTFSKPY